MRKGYSYWEFAGVDGYWRDHHWQVCCQLFWETLWSAEEGRMVGLVFQTPRQGLELLAGNCNDTSPGHHLHSGPRKPLELGLVGVGPPTCLPAQSSF